MLPHQTEEIYVLRNSSGFTAAFRERVNDRLCGETRPKPIDDAFLSRVIDMSAAFRKSLHAVGAEFFAPFSSEKPQSP